MGFYAKGFDGQHHPRYLQTCCVLFTVTTVVEAVVPVQTSLMMTPF